MLHSSLNGNHAQDQRLEKELKEKILRFRFFFPTSYLFITSIFAPKIVIKGQVQDIVEGISMDKPVYRKKNSALTAKICWDGQLSLACLEFG